ncbi:hypothetical protein ACFLZZ_00415 [Nanoarchaeota archaeon]
MKIKLPKINNDPYGKSEKIVDKHIFGMYVSEKITYLAKIEKRVGQGNLVKRPTRYAINTTLGGFYLKRWRMFGKEEDFSKYQEHFEKLKVIRASIDAELDKELKRNHKLLDNIHKSLDSALQKL